MLVTVFTFMLMAMHALHPRLPGLASVTVGFSAGAIATILLFAQDRIPLDLAFAGGGGFSLVSSIFIYRGVLQFCLYERPTSGAGTLSSPDSASPTLNLLPLVYAVGVLAFAVLTWFTFVTPNEAMRVIVIAGAMAITRSIISWTLLRGARGRWHLIALGVTVGAVAFVMTLQALRGALFASDIQHLEPTHLETPSLLFGVLMVCIQGVLYLMMFGGMVTESIHEQAHLDYLTGILNRRGIENSLGAEVARTCRTGIRFSMLLIDIDHFKMINDRCGHAFGDESLRLVAQTVLSAIRIDDRLGRFGGDEFMVLLPQTDGAQALRIASRIVEKIRLLQHNIKGQPMTVSIGATCCGSDEDGRDVTTRADAALYEAKRSGRDCAQLNLGQIADATRTSNEEPLGLESKEPSRSVLMPGGSLPSEA